MYSLAHDEYLYIALTIPFLGLVFWRYILGRRKNLLRLGQPELVGRLMPSLSTSRQIVKFSLLALAMLFLVLGLANPRIGSRLESVKREGIDVVIALDISRSMNTRDLQPSRLDRARQFTSRLIDKLADDRIALEVFAGHAYTQMPLTIDHAAAKLFLTSISTDMAPTQGTALGEAIQLGEQSFRDRGKGARVVILISDGEDHLGKAEEEAGTAAADGMRIYTIGVGTTEGGPIPFSNDAENSGFLRDEESGEVVISKLEDKMLHDIAIAGKGQYYRLGQGNEVVEQLANELGNLKGSSAEARIYSDYESRFQWFVAAALLLLIAEFLLSDRSRHWFKKMKPFKETEIE